jgi:hypothetical protein
MARKALAAAALALGALLAASGNATAGDNGPAKSGFSGGTTMTLGGQGTAAQAAGFDDTELARGGRGGGGGHGGGGHSGFHGGYGGHGYGHGYGGYGGYYGGYGGGYYGGGYYGGGYYSGYSPDYYQPYIGGYGGYGYGYGGYGYGGYGHGGYGHGGFHGGYGHGGYGGGHGRRISGTSDDVDAPAVTLNLAVARNPLVQQPTNVPGPSAGPGTYRYDGGPVSPVPFPQRDSNPNSQVNPAVPPATGLPVSLPKKETKPTNPYTFKAYGEK